MKILIVLPVYNEELVLEKNAKQVLAFCQKNFTDDEFKIVIGDNNSHDQTAEIGRRLKEEFPEIDYFFTAKKGKGVAWREIFLREEADIYIVMDVDLAVELSGTKLLVDGIKEGYDLAVGSRFLKDSVVNRSFFRDLSSSVYRFLVRFILDTKISDFQCGFKAINNKIKENILSHIKDPGFFLDTEITIYSEKAGYRVKQVPVNWSEFRDVRRKSTVNVFETTIEYLKKILKLRREVKKFVNTRKDPPLTN
ncbi:MAG: glycosyltransferase [Patescibacteria group bacterium]